MIHVQETARRRFIIGDTVEELTDYIKPHIRLQSQEFYLREIPRDLEKAGTSLIDGHAAGIMTRLYVRGYAEEVVR